MGPSRLAKFIGVFIVVLVFSATASANQETERQLDVNIEWIAETTSKQQNSFGAIQLDGDQIFAGAEDTAVRSFDKKTGELLWTLERQGRVFWTPQRDGSRIYYASHRGLTAVKRENGEFEWNLAIPSGAENCILVPARKLVIVGGCNGDIYGVAADTGLEVWKLDVLEDAPPAPPGFDATDYRGENHSAMPLGMQHDDQCVYVCIADQCRVIAIDLVSGKKKWSYSLSDAVYFAPAISDEYLIVGCKDDHFHCLDKSTGALKWKFKTDGDAHVRGIIENGLFYAGGADGRMYCINMADGKERWRFEIDKADKGDPFGIGNRPILTSDRLIFAAQDSKVYSLEKSTGKLQWKLRIDSHSAVWQDCHFDGECIYVVLRKRYLRPENQFDPEGLNAIVAIKPPK